MWGGREQNRKSDKEEEVKKKKKFLILMDGQVNGKSEELVAERSNVDSYIATYLTDSVGFVD